MNKYDYARTVFSLHGMRIFSILASLVTTIFIVLSIVNIFTKEWDYPTFLPIFLLPAYLVYFLLWKYATYFLRKAKEEMENMKNEGKK